MRTSVAHLISARQWALDRSSATFVELRRLAMGPEVEIDLDAFGARSQAASYRERMGAQRVGTVEIIPVHNMITQHWSWLTWLFDGTALDWLREAISEAVNDPQVSAIVLAADSPGGEVFGLPEFAADLRSFAKLKPIETQIDPLCASACLWICSQASQVSLTPSGMAGSVGIVAIHVDTSRFYNELGYTFTLIHSGQYKTEGNPYEPLTEEGLARLQLESDHYEDLFYADLGKGRGLSASQMRENFGQGRLLLPAEALQVGMIDRVATLDATLKRLGATRSPAAARSAEAGDGPAISAEADLPTIEAAGGETDPAIEAGAENPIEIETPAPPSESAEEGDPAAAAVPTVPQLTPAQVAVGAARFNQDAFGRPATPPWNN